VHYSILVCIDKNFLEVRSYIFLELQFPFLRC